MFAIELLSLLDSSSMSPRRFVQGWNGTHQVVVTTTDPENAKVFTTRSRAQNFKDNYSDAGYGLVSSRAQIVSHPCSEK